jgi:hypothetical protein
MPPANRLATALAPAPAPAPSVSDFTSTSLLVAAVAAAVVDVELLVAVLHAASVATVRTLPLLLLLLLLVGFAVVMPRVLRAAAAGRDDAVDFEDAGVLLRKRWVDLMVLMTGLRSRAANVAIAPPSEWPV